MISVRMKALACGAAIAVASCASAESRPPPTPPTPRRMPDPSKVRGRLPPELIQKVVRDNFAGMRACYEEGLARDRTLAGKISTKFVIDRDGAVSTAAEIHDAPPSELPSLPKELADHETSSPRFPDPKVTACVVARFRALKFPPPEGREVTVVYPIIFQPEE
ncbi:MAG: AgmX/PglI C-terminal domain-containing protein [Labilithrix sp.]|nr:AgmX/PglI C-terminal domain-containing protein [Labilithrix sp.]